MSFQHVITWLFFWCMTLLLFVSSVHYFAVYNTPPLLTTTTTTTNNTGGILNSVYSFFQSIVDGVSQCLVFIFSNHYHGAIGNTPLSFVSSQEEEINTSNLGKQCMHMLLLEDVYLHGPLQSYFLHVCTFAPSSSHKSPTVRVLNIIKEAQFGETNIMAFYNYTMTHFRHMATQDIISTMPKEYASSFTLSYHIMYLTGALNRAEIVLRALKLFVQETDRVLISSHVLSEEDFILLTWLSEVALAPTAHAEHVFILEPNAIRSILVDHQQIRIHRAQLVSTQQLLEENMKMLGILHPLQASFDMQWQSYQYLVGDVSLQSPPTTATDTAATTTTTTTSTALPTQVGAPIVSLYINMPLWDPFGISSSSSSSPFSPPLPMHYSFAQLKTNIYHYCHRVAKTPALPSRSSSNTTPSGLFSALTSSSSSNQHGQEEQVTLCNQQFIPFLYMMEKYYGNHIMSNTSIVTVRLYDPTHWLMGAMKRYL